MAASVLAGRNSEATADSSSSAPDTTRTGSTYSHRGTPETAAPPSVLLPDRAGGDPRFPRELLELPIQPTPAFTPFPESADGATWQLIHPTDRTGEAWENSPYTNRLQTSHRTWPVCWDPPNNAFPQGAHDSGPGSADGVTLKRPMTVESNSDRASVGAGRLSEDELLARRGSSLWLDTRKVGDATTPVQDDPSRRFRLSAGTASGANPDRPEWLGPRQSGVGPKLAFTARSGLWKVTLGYGYGLDLVRDEREPGHSIWFLYQYNFRREKSLDILPGW